MKLIFMGLVTGKKLLNFPKFGKRGNMLMGAGGVSAVLFMVIGIVLLYVGGFITGTVKNALPAVDNNTTRLIAGIDGTASSLFSIIGSVMIIGALISLLVMIAGVYQMFKGD